MIVRILSSGKSFAGAANYITHAWALDYERENGMVYCGQRLKRPGEREDAPTRDAWMAFQENKKMFEAAEKQLSENNANNSENRKNPENAHAAEWDKLKEMQRQEREAFFNGGKSEFNNLRNSIYGEVREEFRDRWTDYYAARKAGGDDEVLAGMKAAFWPSRKPCWKLGATRPARSCAIIATGFTAIY